MEVTVLWLLVALASQSLSLVSCEDRQTRNLRRLVHEKNIEPVISFSNIRKTSVVDQEMLQREEKSGKPKLKEISEHSPPMTKIELRALHKRQQRRVRSNSGDDKKKGDESPTEKPKKKKIVKCKDHAEDKCKSELEAAGTTIVHDIEGTKYFAVLVDEEEELTINALGDVEGMQDDPERFLSYIEEDESSISSSHHRLLEQTVPAGVDLVRARELWEQFGSKGEGAKVCVIDTGIRSTHEDLNQTNIFGSRDNELEKKWVRTN
jgi:subtilisin family serine protease